MRKVHFIQADVFSDSPFGGNPVVVVPQAQGMSPEEMQALARGMNFAETAFVVEPTLAGAAFGLRCFTPTTEVAFSGHQVLGAAFVLAESGHLVLDRGTTQIEAEVGGDRVPVTLTRRADGMVTRVSMVEQPADFLRGVDDYGALAAALSVDPMEILHTSLPVEVILTGLACLIVPVRSLKTVRELMPMRQALDELLQGVGAVCALVFSDETLSPGNDMHVRVFAPPLGIQEDPATGSANGALAAYLWRHGVVKTRPRAHLRCEQGSEIGRPSVIEVEINTATVPMTILVGGRVARSVEGSVFF